MGLLLLIMSLKRAWNSTISSWHNRFVQCETEVVGTDGGLTSLGVKTFDSYFLGMVYVEFMKNIHLADSNKAMAVRLVSAYWAQKRLIPIF